MKIEAVLDTEDAQVEVTADVSWVEADEESSFGHWDIEDIRYKDTGADVPDELISCELWTRFAELAAEECFARDEASRDARDDLRKEETPW